MKITMEEITNKNRFNFFMMKRSKKFYSNNFLLSLPWIKYRTDLIKKSFIDFILNALLLFFINIKFKSFSLVENLFLLFIWIFISYIFGRYSYPSEKDSNNYKYLFKNIYTFCGASLSLILINLISLKSLFSNIEYSFIFKIMFIFLISSNLINYFIFKKDLNKRDRWLVICSLEKYNLLIKNTELYSRNKVISLIYYQDSLFKSSFKDSLSINNQEFSGAIIDKDWKNYTKYDDLTLKLIINDLEVITLITWCENYLQMVPNEMIDQEYIDALLRKNRIQSNQKRVKRIGDILLSTILLIITSPILVLSSLFIWMEDKGPILYTQKRTGFRNNQIKIYKLRTMFTDAEKDGSKWSSINDTRITKVGKILRKIRVDELPQLFSVLKGDMSLIGPRPERKDFDDILEKEIDFYNIRYFVRPGISGWAQVNHNYTADIEESKIKTSYDIFYINNMSIWIDFLIFIKTIRVVLTAQGAIASDKNKNEKLV